MERKRVVITGMGMVNPLGNCVEEVWKNLLSGKSGIAEFEAFDASGLPSRFGGECRRFDKEGFRAAHPELKDAGRNMIYAAAASMEAMQQAGLEKGNDDPERMGVYLGSGEGEQDFWAFVDMVCGNYTEESGLDTAGFLRTGLKRMGGMRQLLQEPNMASGYLAIMYNAQGPNCNTLTACAASPQAVGEATEIIRRGDADVMVSGGCHSMVHPFGIAGFCLLTALSRENDDPQGASCPFDMRRNGFVLSEGAAIVVLEELEHARKRGARVLTEVIGYGTTADAFRITDSHETGRGAAAAIRMAIHDAGVRPEEIDYISAHGTSTQVNDKVETMAVKQELGEHARKVPMSSPKSMMGHLIAATGASELITCVLAMRDGMIPPTINYQEPDPDCDMDYVPNQSRKHTVNTAMKNSFGFGGQNISLVLRRYDGK